MVSDTFQSTGPVLGRFLERDPLGYPDGLNTYAAYHVLYGGLDPWGLEVCLQTHEVFLNAQHLSIRIVPENQELYKDDPRFDKLPDGRLFTTLGAGPVDDANGDERLVGAHLRDTDVATALKPSRTTMKKGRGRKEVAYKHGRRRPLSPPVDENGEELSEDEWIELLLQAEENYCDDLDYDLFPGIQDSYNSNSYIIGILEFTDTEWRRDGADEDDLFEGHSARYWPGINDPVPGKHFSNPDQ